MDSGINSYDYGEDVDTELDDNNDSDYEEENNVSEDDENYEDNDDISNLSQRVWGLETAVSDIKCIINTLLARFSSSPSKHSVEI